MLNYLWFFLAALFEIAGCYAFWMWLRQGKSAWWIIPALLSLTLFALLLTKVEATYAGRAYAAYGGIYIIASIGWLGLVERIRPTWKAKSAVLRPSARDVIASVGLFTTTVNERGLTWYKPQQALNESAITSIKRPISGGYGFGGDNSLPLEACALALWGAKTCKRDPTRKMRIG